MDELARARALRSRLQKHGIKPRLISPSGAVSREERDHEKSIPLENGWIKMGSDSRGLEVTLPAGDVERLLDLVTDRPRVRWWSLGRLRTSAAAAASEPADSGKA